MTTTAYRMLVFGFAVSVLTGIVLAVSATVNTPFRLDLFLLAVCTCACSAGSLVQMRHEQREHRANAAEEALDLVDEQKPPPNHPFV